MQSIDLNRVESEKRSVHYHAPRIARDFVHEFRTNCESGAHDTDLDTARNYINNSVSWLAELNQCLSSGQFDTFHTTLRHYQSVCDSLKHESLSLLCTQTAEMISLGSLETAQSLLSLIEFEDQRLRPELRELIDSIGQVADSGEDFRHTRVLIVDDDLFAREIAADQLEEHGFEVILAPSGNHAIDIVSAELPDIVLLDIDMPGMDGVETCRHIRQLPAAEHLPIVMMTGFKDDSAVERSYEARATDFVHKPINWAVLLMRLRYIQRSSLILSDLITTQRRLADAQRIARIGHWDNDLKNNRLLLSDQFYEVVGHPVGAFTNFDDLLAITDEGDHTTLVDSFCNHHRSLVCEFRITTAKGESRVVLLKGSAIYTNNNEPLWMMGTIQDVSDQRRDQEIIHRLAYYDDLTGLYNRAAFNKEMQRVLKLHERMNIPVAVLFMDLDGFKRINDSLGHYAGDQLLRGFAKRLSAHLRTSDLMYSDLPPTIARLGGDEFTLMLSGLKRREDAAIVAQRIIDFLKYPFMLEAETDETVTTLKEVYVTTSIGISVFPEDGSSLVELQKNADPAMYAAKQSGKNVYHFYRDSMNSDAHAQLQMETLLRKALENGEFSLAYQPQIDIKDNRIVGAEALLRWQNDELGNVSPAQFIPTAEETGLIAPIGEWVLEQACAQLANWRQQGIDDLKLAVNLSGIQFRQSGFAERVSAVLERHAITANNLELELTESMLMEEIEQAISTMKALKKMGLKLSVDDFGTGYSSLSYLKRFPIDTLKIDRSFVNEIGINSSGEAIIKAIIAMGQSLGLRLVAEGVEQLNQLQYLALQSCEVVQGYYFSKPLFAKEFLEFYHNQGAHRRSAASA